MQLSLFTDDHFNNDPLRFKGGFLSIPVDLLVYALQKRKINQVRLYIGLKSLFNGQFMPDDRTISMICRVMGYKSKKTFIKNLKWLINHNWVHFRKGYCIVSSFNKIKFETEHQSYRCVIFKPEKDLKKFRPFCYGAVITHLMKLKGSLDRDPGTENRRSPYTRYHQPSTSLNMPVTWLAAALGISKGAASNYRNEAARAGYLKVKRSFLDLNLDIDFIEQYKRYSGNSQLHKLRVIKGRLQIQLPDKITSKLVVKRKRSIRNAG